MEEKLTHFYSIGPIQSEKLLAKLLDLNLLDKNKVQKNEYTLSELRKILKSKKIFDSLSEATKTDLTYNPLRVIPRPIIEVIDQELHNIIKNIKFDIAGSYIRGKSTSGDIDMVLSTDKENIWDYIMNKINQNSSIIKFHEPFAKGTDKIATLIEVDLIKSNLIKKHPDFKKLFKCNSSCKVNVKIDIFLTNLEEYMFALLFATGSGLFNIRMRSVAKKKGYLLNNHGLWKKISENIMEKVSVKNEKDLFDILKIKYKTPRERVK